MELYRYVRFDIVLLVSESRSLPPISTQRFIYFILSARVSYRNYRSGASRIINLAPWTSVPMVCGGKPMSKHMGKVVINHKLSYFRINVTTWYLHWSENTEIYTFLRGKIGIYGPTYFFFNKAYKRKRCWSSIDNQHLANCSGTGTWTRDLMIMNQPSVIHNSLSHSAVQI